MTLRGPGRWAREALAIRRFAIDTLLPPPVDSGPAGGSARPPVFAPVEPPAAVAAASARAWIRFLAVERCGRPLLRALSGTGGAGGDSSILLPDDSAALLRERAREETLHVLVARRQLREVADLARRHGYRPVVLKGGAAVLDEGAVDLADLDLLLPRQEAEAFADLLSEEAGYSAHVSGRRMLHLDRQVRSDRLPLEVHLGTGAPVGEPIEWHAVPPLRRLRPPDQLRHLLEHSCAHHLRLRGRIRDLLLIARNARACTAAERDAVRQWASTHPRAGALERQLGMAAGSVSHDPFRAEAATLYLFAEWKEGRPSPPGAFEVVLRRATLAALCSPREVAGQLHRAFTKRRRNPWSRPWLRRLERTAPRLARGVAGLLRAARLAAVLLVAAPIALAARLLARSGS